MTITGSCAASGTISGTISGYALTGTLTATNLETINITAGMVATDYNSASGMYQVTSATGNCSAAMSDTGTWIAKRMSPGGTYAGMLLSAERIPVQLTLSLKSDGSQLSGTATFTNSACLRSMSVEGTQTGMNLELRSDAGTDGSVVLTGNVSEEGKTLTLSSAVSGSCQAESGAGKLTKMQ